MGAVIISPLQFVDEPVEIVERKGLGHPDTICDAMAETFSRALCREYRNRFGAILHHNVDKALLCGGRAAPAFGGGAILAPIHVYLAGRAVSQVANDHLPVAEIAVESARAWLRANMHAMDAERHVKVHARIQPGSIDLQTLFPAVGSRDVALANDTSVGVGHAPLSPLERLVLTVEKRINGRDRAKRNPAWGEDVKVMGVRHAEAVNLTVACAMIGQHLAHLDDYLAEKAAVAKLVHGLAIEHGFANGDVAVNLADKPAAGSVYLTVTGSSAEAGDDGQVGRGNRVNGLITPCRPMSSRSSRRKEPGKPCRQDIQCSRVRNRAIGGGGLKRDRQGGVSDGQQNRRARHRTGHRSDQSYYSRCSSCDRVREAGQGNRGRSPERHTAPRG